ncbi:hypothetical protein [Sphingomonas hominis]
MLVIIDEEHARRGASQKLIVFLGDLLDRPTA